MYADVKVTVWQRVKLNEDENVTKEKVIEAIKMNGASILFEMDGTDPDWEVLVETEEYITPEENGGCSTIELYDDNGKLLWENGTYNNTDV